MNEPFLERIEHDGTLLGLILRSGFRKEGTHFFSPADLSQQLGYMKLPKGQLIEPHIHNPTAREVVLTQEVLVILSGRLRVDFYSQERQYVESRVLGPHDVVMLIDGGHGFEVLEPIEMLEVKQGPYLGDADKTRFAAIETTSLRVRGDGV